MPRPGGRRPVARQPLGRAVGACQPMSPLCVAQRTAGGAFAVRAVLQRHTGRFAMPNDPFRAAERPVWATRWHSATLRPGAQSLVWRGGRGGCGPPMFGAPVGISGAGLCRRPWRNGRHQGVGAYSGNARLPVCIKIMSVGLAVAWRLVAMAASVRPAWNIELRLNIFFPAPCPAFD